MASKTEYIEEALKNFEKEIEQIFGKNLVSIILYGSAATNEFTPGVSDINFMVVLDRAGMKKIDKVQKFLKRWEKRNITLPLFFTEDYINGSLDSFPIEFLNMKISYRLIRGKDILKDIKIRVEDLRLQCEREMKANLLKLRQGYIKTMGRQKRLKSLISQSLVSFISIFRALLYIKEVEIPETKRDVLLETCREFKLNETLFSLLISVREHSTTLGKGELTKKVSAYISEIERLSEMVDRMRTGKSK